VATPATYLGPGAGWYPDTGARRLTYTLRVTAPSTHTVVAPGQSSPVETRAGRTIRHFRAADPLPGISLFGGPYRINRRTSPGGVALGTYLHEPVSGVAEDYLATAARYVDRFSQRYGPYPHAAFRLVSSPWPTGFGYPGIAYMGKRILPLPFIREGSLPHEILHNWWGNGVYVAEDSGNWAEGLTTFGADYRIEAADSPGAARALRRRWLEDFASYHREAPAPPLRHFRGRVDEASRTVGYNKAAFLWIMLRDRLGPEAFRAGLRRFYARHRFRDARWADLRRAFEKTADEGLASFFDQWLDRRGAPRLELVSVRPRDDRVRFTLGQPDPAYALDLPVRLHFADGSRKTQRVRFHKAEQAFTVSVGEKRLSALEVDPAYRIFRRLKPAEVPPRLAGVLARGAGAGIRLENGRDNQAWRAAARKLGQGLWGENPALNPDDAPAAVRVVSPEALHRVWGTLDGIRSLPEALRKGPTPALVGRSGPGGEPVLLVAAEDPSTLVDLARPLPHYGSYGWLAFRGGRNVAKGRWPPPERPLRWQPPGQGDTGTSGTR
jgi:hypothetical protein